MAQDFYPFVENKDGATNDTMQVRHPARIAVYDDAAAAPRVVVVEPKDVREYLEEITLQVTQLSAAQGGTIPFMVIREIVENFIHAYFIEPTISILDKGNTIRFSDQGPGIVEKSRALQYGTTSATEEMRRYIRGVGSGLPYVQQYMQDKGGSLKIDDNMSGGTVVTISTVPSVPTQPYGPQAGTPQQNTWPQQQMPQAPWGSQPAPWQQGGQPTYQQDVWGQSPQQPVPQQSQSPWVPAQDPRAPYQQQPWPVQQTWQNQPAPAVAHAGVPASHAGDTTSVPLSPGAGAGDRTSVPLSPGWPEITVRGRAILDYLMAHDSVGPSELARTYGESQPTWTRELQALEEAGLIRKDGQKRRLTAMGRSFAQGA